MIRSEVNRIHRSTCQIHGFLQQWENFIFGELFFLDTFKQFPHDFVWSISKPCCKDSWHKALLFSLDTLEDWYMSRHQFLETLLILKWPRICLTIQFVSSEKSGKSLGAYLARLKEWFLGTYPLGAWFFLGQDLGLVVCPRNMGVVNFVL